MSKEIWKQIYGFPGYYISNCGRVRGKTKIYSQQMSNSGYKQITIFRTIDDKKEKSTRSVHRLVALHFIPNPGLNKVVNHINGDKTDNRVENLEWCSSSYNVKHAYGMGLIPQWNKKPVRGFTKNGEVLEFESSSEAGRVLGITANSINAVCNKSNPHRHTAGGIKWEFI